MTRLNRRLTALIGVGVLSVTLAVAAVHSGAVGVYDGLNKGVYVGDYGLELVGEPGFFHNVVTPPCAEEDSPGPCFWDAGKRGNGEGLSFWVDAEQAVHYEIEGK